MEDDGLIGQRLGSYVVREKVGQGGMGAVYLAQHVVIGRRAAAKVLLPELSNDKGALDRFFGEAKATAQLRHPAMVDVFDCGTLGDGRAFILMDFLDGESVEARLERIGRCAPDEALRIARQVALGMSVAHESGIIHRDLKPDNIFLVPAPAGERDEQVKILDFGIAKLTRQDGAISVSHTRTGAVLGTPLYMSPEQCRGAGAVDQRTDLYSLGCVLFTLLTGRPPFLLEGVGEIIAAQIYDEPPSLAACGLPNEPELEALVARALAKSAAARQPSMRALADEIEALLTTRRTSTPAGLASASAGEARAPAARPEAVTTPARRAAPSLSGAAARDRSTAEQPPPASEGPAASPGRGGATIAAVAGAVALVGVLFFVQRGRPPRFEDASRRAGPSAPPSGAKAPGGMAPGRTAPAAPTPAGAAAPTPAGAAPPATTSSVPAPGARAGATEAPRVEEAPAAVEAATSAAATSPRGHESPARRPPLGDRSAPRAGASSADERLPSDDESGPAKPVRPRPGRTKRSAARARADLRLIPSAPAADPPPSEPLYRGSRLKLRTQPLE